MTPINSAKKERKTIAVFISRVGRVWGLEFLAGVTHAAEAHDLNLICFVGGKPNPIITPGHLQSSYGLYDLARTEQLSGIIISGDLGYELNQHETRLFIEAYAHIPLIVNALQVQGIPNLISDNMGGMRAAVGHMITQHNCQQIAFIRGPQHQVEAEQRLLAYRQELSAHKIKIDENLIVQGDFSPESGRAAIHMLLDERKVKLDAIIAANDRMAIGAFEALQLRGIQVPGSIALAGFDDVREARTMAVPLTTVRQPFFDMGKQAVDMLERRMAGEEVPQNIINPTQLIVRWSCGCLPESVRGVIVEKEDVARTSHLDDKKDAALRDLLLAAEMADDDAQSQAFKLAAEQAWDGLMVSLRDVKQSENFLHSVEILISAIMPHTEDASIWHNVISVLRKHTLAGLKGSNASLLAENLFQQARLLTGELSQRVQALRRLEVEQQEEVLQSFSSSMAPALSLDEIGQAIERHFPGMGIERLYVMLYANMASPQSTLVPPSENYHMLMQYDEAGFQMPSDQPKWGTGRLIPRGKTPENRRYTAIVMPLTLAQNRFGFLWMEMSAREWEVYVRVRNLISSALFRTMLVEQRTVAQKEVEHLLDESKLREVELALAKEKAEKNANENARLFTNEQERRKVAEALSKAARNLSTLLKMDEVPQQILKQLTQVLPYERGALLMEELDGTTHIVAHLGFPEDPRADDLRIQIDSGGVYDQIAYSGEQVIIDDVTTASSWQQVDWLPINHSWMGIPLFSKNKVIGMLSLTRKEEHAFSEDDLLLVTTYGMQAAIALENARLYDELTRFNELMERMVSQRVEELNSAYTTLEKLDKNKTSFIQVSAHELRTPITVMKGYLGMLKSNPAIQQNDGLVQAVEGVLKGTDRLHLIVNSMLDVARLEGQNITPHMETVIIGLVFQLVHKEYKSDLAKRNIKFIIEEGIGSLPLLQADPKLLQKALDTVIVNAIKYTPDGGTITCGSKAVNDERLGASLEIYVRDTGIGIDPANQRVIFEKMFQVGKTELHSSGRTKFKGGGPGLGLAIAAGIVKAHNGKIWVESPGCDEETLPGCTFFIRLPLPKESETRA
jgi:DNA-binding LacI/PurR family transcriptional regulator/signal transduction histidine kinase